MLLTEGAASRLSGWVGLRSRGRPRKMSPELLEMLVETYGWECPTQPLAFDGVLDAFKRAAGATICLTTGARIWVEGGPRTGDSATPR